MTDRLHFLLVGALVVLLGVGVVLQRRRGAAAQGRRAGPAPTDPSIGRRFRQRRLGCLLSWLILGPAALFLLVADTERFAVASMVTLAARSASRPPNKWTQTSLRSGVNLARKASFGPCRFWTGGTPRKFWEFVDPTTKTWPSGARAIARAQSSCEPPR